MKGFRLGLLLLSAAAIASGTASGEFDVKAYSPETGVVELRCGEDYTNRLLSSFSWFEQKKIAGQLADKAFQGSDLRITVEKKKTTEKISEQQPARTRTGQIDKIRYVVTLENRAPVEIGHIVLGSHVFYEESDGTNRTKRVLSGTREVSLRPGEKIDIAMGEVSIRDELITIGGRTIESTFFGQAQALVTSGTITRKKDRLVGMHLDVSRDDVQGQNVSREEEDGNPPPRDLWSKYSPAPVNTTRDLSALKAKKPLR